MQINLFSSDFLPKYYVLSCWVLQLVKIQTVCCIYLMCFSSFRQTEVRCVHQYLYQSTIMIMRKVKTIVYTRTDCTVEIKVKFYRWYEFCFHNHFEILDTPCITNVPRFNILNNEIQCVIQLKRNQILNFLFFFSKGTNVLLS